jgi:hypothetical protein
MLRWRWQLMIELNCLARCAKWSRDSEWLGLSMFCSPSPYTREICHQKTRLFISLGEALWFNEVEIPYISCGI